MGDLSKHKPLSSYQQAEVQTFLLSMQTGSLTVLRKDILLGQTPSMALSITFPMIKHVSSCFWSKNPYPLLDYLHILEERNIKCYIQYTLNDYESEKLEKVPSLEKRIETFKLLVERLGKGSVVWRFDPMILTDDISIDDLLAKVQNIGDKLKGYTEKLVFSYADIALYKKVKANLERSGIAYHEWTEEQMEIFAQKLSAMNRERGWNYTLSTCGEKIDISKYGIEHNRCIDGDLITRIAWKDQELMNFMKVKIEDVPAPSLFGDAEIPQDAILLPNNKFFISAHKR